MRQLLSWLMLTLAATGSFALAPGSDVFLPSVGKGQGSCPGGVCSQWVTSVWILNPNNQAASVRIAFLERDRNNSSPVTRTVTVPVGQTMEFPDVMGDPFGLTEVYGALRFTSNVPVVVTGRIFDSNVVTNKGTGSAGQFMGGANALSSIGQGQSTEIVGLARNSSWRSNVGFIEVTGNAATVRVERLSGAGAVIGSTTISALPFEAKLFSLNSLGGASGTNQRVRFRVTGGTGRIIATGSRVDNSTGDPSTVDMVNTGFDPLQLAGTWYGAWYNARFGSSGDATMTISYVARTQTLEITVDIDGNAFGAADPPAETLSATLGSTGFSFTGSSPSYGDLDVTIDVTGEISGELFNPTAGIDYVAIEGAVTENRFMIRYTVDLGADTADGFLWLTRT